MRSPTATAILAFITTFIIVGVSGYFLATTAGVLATEAAGHRGQMMVDWSVKVAAITAACAFAITWFRGPDRF